MGYTTEFTGSLIINPPLSPERARYIQAFCETRRMNRSQAAEMLNDEKREAVGLPLGIGGGYFVGGGGFAGQEHDASIVNYNSPPDDQPGLWCQWTVDDAGTQLMWNEAEKFYAYTEWLKYLVEHFFKPWGCALNGEIEWQGEDSSDSGTIYVKDSLIEAVSDTRTNDGPSWANR